MNEFWYSVAFAAVIGIGIHLVIQFPSFSRFLGVLSILISLPVTYLSWKSYHSFPESPLHILLANSVSKLPVGNLWVTIDDIAWDCSKIYHISRDNGVNTYVLFSNPTPSLFGVATFDQELSCDEILSMAVSGTLDHMSVKRISYLEKNGVKLPSRKDILEYCTYCGKNNSKMGVISGVSLFGCGVMLLATDKIERFVKQKRYQKKQPNTACTRRVGVAAFSSSLCGWKLVPAKWRCLVPPTRG